MYYLYSFLFRKFSPISGVDEILLVRFVFCAYVLCPLANGAHFYLLHTCMYIYQFLQTRKIIQIKYYKKSSS